MAVTFQFQGLPSALSRTVVLLWAALPSFDFMELNQRATRAAGTHLPTKLHISHLSKSVNGNKRGGKGREGIPTMKRAEEEECMTVWRCSRSIKTCELCDTGIWSPLACLSLLNTVLTHEVSLSCPIGSICF